SDPIAPPTPEIGWLEPFPDEWLADQGAVNPEAHYSAYESISLAFLAALQTLPPRQRAVLILNDVLDWSAQETAELLGTTVSAVASMLRRARVTMAATYHGRSPDERRGPGIDQHTQRMLDRYMHAWQTADVAGLVDLLKEDAVLSMPPSPSWYRGSAAVGAFVGATVFAEQGMFGGKASGRWKLVPTRANGEPAFAAYQSMENGELQPSGVQVLTFEGGRISVITSFVEPSLTQWFKPRPAD
ncbi:MAG: RNA polymerase subunit sigma-70, partial [Anaerolineae bacterium]